MTNSITVASLEIKTFIEGASSALIARDAQEAAGLCYLGAILGTAHVHLSVKGKGNKPKLGIQMKDLVARIWNALPEEAKFSEAKKATVGQMRGIKLGSLTSYMSTLNQLIDVNGKRYQVEFSDAARRGDVPAMQAFLRGKGVFTYAGLCALGKAKGKGGAPTVATPLERAVRAVIKLQTAGKKKLSPEQALIAVAMQMKCLPALKRLATAK